MLDTTKFCMFTERWNFRMVAATEVTGALLSRAALEVLLEHFPLAQVFLRITLSKARAEALQLETVEKVAGCLLPPPPPPRRKAPPQHEDSQGALGFARHLKDTLVHSIHDI